MSGYHYHTFLIADTSPAAVSTTIGGVAGALSEFDWLTVDADLLGAAGGTLDVYLQREVTDGVWRDWCHFPQLADGAAAVSYTTTAMSTNDITTVGTGTASAATPALAADTIIGGQPGNKIRAVYVAGAGTSAGAAQVIRITGWRRKV